MENPFSSPFSLESQEMISVAKLLCKNLVYPHQHDFIEMVFIAQGSCRHSYLNTEVLLTPGDFFVVTPYETHAYSIDSEALIYNCLFYPQALGDDFTSLRKVRGIFDFLLVEPFFRDEAGKQQILRAPAGQTAYIQELLDKMIEESRQQKSGYQIMQKANLITLIVTLARIHEQTFDAQPQISSSKRALLEETLSYVEQNLSEELKVDDLAAQVFLSPTYFRKIFKESVGMSPIEYINHIRIKKAIQLLQGQQHTISEIANLVGITDTNYFSRIFRSVMGCSPSSFIRSGESPIHD